MNAGTTTDTFLRENLEWLGRASHWAKFTATASIGVVHKGHVKESMNLLQVVPAPPSSPSPMSGAQQLTVVWLWWCGGQPYLPQGGVSASPYSEAGALYALGLIHASKGGAGNADTIAYLREALRYGPPPHPQTEAGRQGGQQALNTRTDGC